MAAQELHMVAQGLHLAAQWLQMHYIAVYAVYGCGLASPGSWQHAQWMLLFLSLGHTPPSRWLNPGSRIQHPVYRIQDAGIKGCKCKDARIHRIEDAGLGKCPAAWWHPLRGAGGLVFSIVFLFHLLFFLCRNI